MNRLIGFSLATFFVAKIVVAGDWIQAQGDPAKNGMNLNERLPAPLVLKLDTELNASSTEWTLTHGSMVIQGTTLVVTSSEGTTVQMNWKTGNEGWRVRASGPVRGTPALDGMNVLVGSRDGRHTSYALDGTGFSPWSVFMGGTISTPTTLALVGGTRRAYLGTASGRLVCVNPDDGQIVWSATLGGAIWGAPSVNETSGRVYVASYDQRVYAFDAMTGSRKWIFIPAPLPLGPVRSPLAVFGSRLYVPTIKQGLIAIDDQGTQASEMWRTKLTNSHTGGVAVVAETGLTTAVIFVANAAGELRAFADQGTPVLRWSRSGLGRIDGGVVVADGKVVVATEGGKVILTRTTNGATVQEFVTHGPVNADPAVGRGLVGVVDAAGHLVAYGNPIEPPVKLSAFVVGCGQVRLAWAQSPQSITVSGYRVYRSTVPNAESKAMAFVSGVNSLTYLDTNVTPGILYYYAVTTAEKAAPPPAGRESAFSDVIRARVGYATGVQVVSTVVPALPTTGQVATYRIVVTNPGDAALPAFTISDTLPAFSTGLSTAQPAGVTAQPLVAVGAGSVRAVWSSSGFTLAPGASLTVSVTGIVAPIGVVTDLVNTVMVAAANACGATQMQDHSAARFYPAQAISGLTAVAGDGYVTLRWQLAPGGAIRSSLHVQRRDRPAGVLSVARTLSASATSLVDMRVEDGTGYDYLVVAVDTNGVEMLPTPLVTATPMIVDWPMYQRDTLHDAHDPGVFMNPPFAEAWRVRLATTGGRGFSGYQGGLVVDGTLFVSSTGGDVLACNPVTGSTIWFQTGYPTDGGNPVIHHGLMYLTHDGGLTVFRVGDGSVAWNLPVSVVGIGQPSAPIIYHGLLVAGVILNNAFQVVAVDIDPSSPTYQQVRWNMATGIDKTSPAASNGIVYIGDNFGAIHARDAETGAVVWDSPVGVVQAGVAISLFVAPPVLVVNHVGTTSALDLATGAIRWSYPSGAVFTAPASAGATVFISSTATQVFALKAGSGATVWVAATATPGPCGPLVSQRLVHVCTPSGEFASFDRKTGQPGPALQLANTAAGIATLSAGAGFVYVPTGDGQLIAVTSVPAAPLGLTARPAGLSIVLGWSPVAENGAQISAYRIYRSTIPGMTGAVLEDMSWPAAGGYTDLAVFPNVTYYYRVAAVDVRGVAGQLSNVAFAQVSIPVPSLPFLIAGDGLTRLAWSLPPGSAGGALFNVYRREGTSGPLTLYAVFPSATPGFTDHAVENRIPYTYAVSVVDSKGDEGPLSNAVSGTPMTVGWPMFRRDALHENSDTTADLTPPLGEFWHVDLGGTFRDGQTAVEVSGTVFACTSAGVMGAFRAQTGETLWLTGGLNQPMAAPACHDGRLYVVDFSGLKAIRAVDGSVEWTLSPSAVGVQTGSPPTVYRGVLYVGMTMTRSGSVNGYVVAVDVAARKVKWISASQGGFTSSSPTASRGTIFVSTVFGHLVALDAETGVTRWTAFNGSANRATVAVDLAVSPRVVVTTGADGLLRAFDDSTNGGLVWTRQAGSVFTSPAIAGATVVIASDTAHAVVGVGAVAGATRWQMSVAPLSATSPVYQNPVLAAGQSHVTTSATQIVTSGLSSGTILEVFTPGMPLPSANSSLGSGLWLVPSVTGRLTAFTRVAPAPTGISAVRLFDSQVYGDVVFVRWNTVQPNGYAISGYRIYRATSPTTPSRLVSPVNLANSGSYMTAWDPLFEGGRTYYRVAAVDVRGVEGRLSATVSIDLPLPSIYAIIVSPSGTGFVCPGSVPVRGVAVTTGSMDRWALEVDQGSGYSLVMSRTFNSTGLGGASMGSFNLTLTPGGRGTLRLTVVDKSGLSAMATVPLRRSDSNALASQIAFPANGQIVYVACTVPWNIVVTGQANGGSATPSSFSRYTLTAVDAGSGALLGATAPSSTPVFLGPGGTPGVLGSLSILGCRDVNLTLSVFNFCGEARSVTIRYSQQPRAAVVTPPPPPMPTPPPGKPPAPPGKPPTPPTPPRGGGGGRPGATTPPGISGSPGNSPPAPPGGGGRPVAAMGPGAARSLSVRGRGPGEHRLPVDVAVDRENYLWIVDTQNRRVQKMTGFGQLLFEVGDPFFGAAVAHEFREPVAAAVDADDHVLVLDQATSVVAVLDEDGRTLRSFGAPGRGPGEFDHPSGLAVDAGGTIYVADTQNNRIQVLGPGGQPLFAFGERGSAPGEFEHPTGVAIDSNTGTILVTDEMNHRIQLFTSAGQFIAAHGSKGSGLDEFRMPYEAVASRDFTMFATDRQNDRLAFYALTDGGPVFEATFPGEDLTFSVFSQPHGLALDHDDAWLYVADTFHSRIVGLKIKNVGDSVAPRADIVLPEWGATVTGVVEVRGTAADSEFSEYRIEAGYGEEPALFESIASSTTPVWDGSLGLWDTRALAAGPWTLRVTVYDASGNVTVAAQRVCVSGASMPVISSISIGPTPLRR